MQNSQLSEVQSDRQLNYLTISSDAGSIVYHTLVHCIALHNALVTQRAGS